MTLAPELRAALLGHSKALAEVLAGLLLLVGAMHLPLDGAAAAVVAAGGSLMVAGFAGFLTAQQAVQLTATVEQLLQPKVPLPPSP